MAFLALAAVFEIRLKIVQRYAGTKDLRFDCVVGIEYSFDHSLLGTMAVTHLLHDVALRPPPEMAIPESS